MTRFPRLIRDPSVLLLAVAAGLVLAAGRGGAADGDAVQARSALMKSLAENSKLLEGMGMGTPPYDANRASQARAQMAEDASNLAPAFAGKGEGDQGKASEKIWKDWDGFQAEADDLSNAVQALDASSPESLQRGIGAVKSACQTCHSSYRN